MGNFDRVGVSHCICVICQHFLRAVVRLHVVVQVLWVEVAFGDDAAADGRWVIRLQVDIINLTLELHGEGSSMPCVDKPRTVTC